MTTYFQFQPTSQSNFTFNPTLDGAVYQAIVTWSLFGQRYYLNLYSSDGTLVFSKAMVASPVGVPIESLSWDLASTTVTVETTAEHGYTIGQTIDLTISGCSPETYNGKHRCLITGPASFTYGMDTDPGTASAFGSANYNINMVEGYFETSTLVLRNNAFEVSP